MRVRLLLSNFLKLSLILLVGGCLQAQKVIRVVNSENIALVGVDVHSSDYSFLSSSDSVGIVRFPSLKRETKIHFKYLGFEEKVLKYRQILDGPNEISLFELEEIIEEVVVVGRTDALQEELPYTLEYIKQEDLALSNSQTAADGLQNNANVYVQKSQLGGGSPVIRGFEASRVLLVIDGVRMNNAIYRNGHLQNAITVDQSMLKRTEILYGPGSLIYGSDALGGVVHFRTKSPILNFSTQKPVKQEINTLVRYSSANKEKTYHLDFNLGFKKLGFLTSFSYSDFGDLKMGSKRTSEYPDFGKRLNYVETTDEGDQLIENDDPNLQVGTAYKQYDFLQKILIQASDRLQITGNVQYSTSSDIPRYDALIEQNGSGLKYAEWNYGPQKRFLSSLATKLTLDKSWVDEILIIPSFQFIEEDRVNRLFDDQTREHNEEDVSIYMMTIDFKKSISQNTKLSYGIDFSYNDVVSEAYSENIVTGELKNDILTRYPGGGSSMSNIGTYAHFQWQSVDSNFRVFSGIRFSKVATSITFQQNDIVDWPMDFLSGLKNNNAALTWSLGLNYVPSKNTIVRAIASSAFRSPNVDDLSKIRVKSDEISFPNLELKSEKSLNFELGLTQQFSLGRERKFIFNLTGFYTKLKDAIVRESFSTPDGQTIFMNRGDTLNIVANVNAQDAFIGGISTNFEFHASKFWFFSASYNYVKGREVLEGPNVPLAHIPPSYGKFEIGFKRSGMESKLIVRYNGKKSLSEYGGSTDNEEFATSEGALAWYTINYYASYNISPSFQINIGLENILNKHYRPFASGLNGAGRNAIVSLRSKF